MLFYAIPLLMLILGAAGAIFRPLITAGVAFVASILLNTLAEGMGSAAVALIPHILVAYALVFTSLVAFFARLAERRKNAKKAQKTTNTE